MAKHFKLLVKYLPPSYMFLLAYVTLVSDPTEPLLATVPIVPGRYQHEIAALFVALGLALAASVFIYERRKAAASGQNGA